MKIYGPYIREDGRQHIIYYDNGKRRTQSYPRYLMEQFLGRQLTEEEHVDHINNDFTDNRIENLQLLSQRDNNRKSAKTTYMYFECPVCGDGFFYSARRYRDNQLTQGKSGPYCSRQCAGKSRK